MTDRELLELAAKASGYVIESWIEIGAWVYDPCVPIPDEGEPNLFIWNPLADDGDALRLAVKLRITVGFGQFACQINCSTYDWAEDEMGVEVYEDGREDPYAATRRAIVRAAAEIGREHE